MIQEYLNYTALSLAYLFIGFVFVMKVKNRLDKETWQYDLFMYIFGYTFALADLLVNWLISGVFLDWPNSWNELVTDRMKRYKKISKLQRDYNVGQLLRYHFAVLLCALLNMVDKGHCDA